MQQVSTSLSSSAKGQEAACQQAVCTLNNNRWHAGPDSTQLEPGMSTRTHRADLRTEGVSCTERPASAGSLLGTLVVGDSSKKVGHCVTILHPLSRHRDPTVVQPWKGRAAR